MPAYWLSYRIHADATREARAKELTDRVKAMAGSSWEDSTSFLIFSSEQNIDAIAQDLKSAINLRTDLIVLCMTEVKAARLAGAVNDEAIFKLMPHIRKV